MYQAINPNAIRPKGWLKQQLRLQADGLCGNLSEMWPDVSNSVWIGGDKDGWERVPYWLDGAIPQAQFLEDPKLLARVEDYVQSILSRQQEDGWICPEAPDDSYDIWAVFLIGKVLALYCEFTDSKDAEKALYKSMKHLHESLIARPGWLREWGKFRWYECLIPLKYLYDRYPERWILDLAKNLQKLGADYPSFVETWKRPLNKWTFHTHIVNLGMMFKFEAVCTDLFGSAYESQAEDLWNLLETYNGTAVGTFTGDECLGGIGNNRGTELCAVVELMYSCELLYRVTGNPIWADRLEKLAFNAMPATFSDDMWTHQYDQQVNQIACQRFPGKSFFGTNDSEAHLFGLEPNYGCCTANLGQGWPKLVMNTFLKTEDGILCPMMLPAELNTQISGVPVRITMETEYPFRLGCTYRVHTDRPVEFTLQIRIPGWAAGYTADGEDFSNSGFHTIRRIWNGDSTITLTLQDAPKLVKRPGDLYVAEYGPLVFSLPIETRWDMREYERNGVVRKFPYCDYELVPQSAWNYGFRSTELQVCYTDGDDVPFSSKAPRITLTATMAQVPWDFADGYETVAATHPTTNIACGPDQTMTLYPYGCAKLRMTEMPTLQPAD